MVTFYVASSRDGLPTVRQVARALELAGMRNAFAWPEHFDHRCSADSCGIADRRDLARREIEAASSCDVFIGIARLGKGSHVELGLAIGGRASLVILVGVDPIDSVFYASDSVVVVPSPAAAIDLAAAYHAPRPSRYTIRRAIVILADAAAHDGQVLVAARRLGMYQTKASALALRAFFDDTAIQDGDTRQRLACGAAEALMRQGWLP